MSRRIGYLGRTDRGGRVSVVRLVGRATDERWDAPAASPAAEPGAEAARDIAAAARWVADRFAADDDATALHTLCVDVDGSLCTWLTAPSADASVVTAALGQSAGGAGEGQGATGSDRAGSLWGFDADLSSSNTVQALAVTQAPAAAQTSAWKLRRGPAKPVA